MKKILLGTTTLIGAATLFAGAAFAGETPKVTIGGFADFQYGYASQDNDAAIRGQAFRSDTEVTLRIDGKTDAGLGYGGGIDLEADTTDDADNQGTNASRTFVYVDGAWGRLQGGSDLGVTNTMKIDASRIARATGGIDGDWNYFAAGFAAPAAGSIITTPDLVMDYGAGALGDESTENANKVSYYTPRFSGFQAGVSYIIAQDNKGQAVAMGDVTDGQAENVFQGAVNWEGKWNDFAISLGGTGEWGSAEESATVANHVEDLSTWQLGAMVKYMGFSVAGSYADWGDSLTLKTANLNDRHFWTLGAAYEMGAFGTSVTWMDSTAEATSTTDNKFDNISVGVDYKLAPGFTPYAEVNFISYDPAGTAQDNDATIFIAGTQLAF